MRREEQAVGNVPNRTIFVHDNLPVLRGMDSASVDLVYLDPPFNSGQEWAAPIGSEAAGASFRDAWTLSDIDVAWRRPPQCPRARTFRRRTRRSREDS